MLWRKFWLESRWRFWIGLALGCVLAATVVLSRPIILKTLPTMPPPPGRLGEILRESMVLMQSYPGYVWSQWFGKNLLQLWTVFSILLGAGGLLVESSRGSALFTLSLPVTRRRLLAVRAATGAVELALIALVPSLLVSALSPMIGESYPIRNVLMGALLMTLGGLVFYAFSFLLSSVFGDLLKPIVIGLVVTFLLSLLPLLSKTLVRWSPYTVMSGQSWFASGSFPWTGLAACLAFAAALLYLSFRLVERRDF